MFSNVTAGTLLTSIRHNLNEYMAASVLTDSFFIFHLNNAIKSIYTKDLWSWSRYREEVELVDWKWTLTYRPRRILFVRDISTGDKSVFQEYNFSDESNEFNERKYFVRNWKGIEIFNKDDSTKVEVFYYRFPKTLTSFDDKLDIPIMFNDVVYNYLMVNLTPVWLGEWVWQMMGNFKDLWDSEVGRLKIDDSYSMAWEEWNPSKTFNHKIC